jgi:pimeloyl-ACP methyl ester carboxylesterase
MADAGGPTERERNQSGAAYAGGAGRTEAAMTPRTQETFRAPLAGGCFLAGIMSRGSKPADAAVLYVHGFGSLRSGEKAQALEAACTRRGWTFAAIDFRGHGESSGTMLDLRCRTLLEDLDRFHQHLADLGIPRLYPVGSSMGGWAAAWFAVRHPETVSACVLLAPAFDFPRGLWDRLDEAQRLAWYQTGRLRVQNEWIDQEVNFGLIEEADRYAAGELIAAWRTPLLIFHGMRDDVVPYARTVAVVEQMKYPGIEVRLFKDGDHRLSGLHDEIAEAACAFFARHGFG